MEQVKKEMKAYKAQRQLTLKNIRDFVSLKNQLTFVSNDLLERSVGPNVKASRMSFYLNDQITEAQTSLSESLLQMETVLKSITTYIHNATKKKDFPVDMQIMQQLLDQMQQQFLLEASIIHKFITTSDNIEQDNATAMISCFEYSPYLSVADFDAFLLC